MHQFPQNLSTLAYLFFTSENIPINHTYEVSLILVQVKGFLMGPKVFQKNDINVVFIMLCHWVTSITEMVIALLICILQTGFISLHIVTAIGNLLRCTTDM